MNLINKISDFLNQKPASPLKILDKKEEAIKKGNTMFKLDKKEIIKGIIGIVAKKIKGGKKDGGFKVVKSIKKGLKYSIPVGTGTHGVLAANSLPENITINIKGTIIEIPTALVVAIGTQLWHMVSSWHKHRKIT